MKCFHVFLISADNLLNKTVQLEMICDNLTLSDIISTLTSNKPKENTSKHNHENISLDVHYIYSIVCVFFKLISSYVISYNIGPCNNGTAYASLIWVIIALETD